jgi:chemotaxis protein MotB
MKIDPRMPLRPLVLLVLAAAGSACVAQTRYDEARTEIQYYQRKYQELESYQGTLEAENERLKGELAIYQGTLPIDANVTKDIDERLERLRQITESVGMAPGDVTVLSIEGGYGLRVTDAILFDSGSSEVRPEGRELLLKLAQQIQSQPYQRIWVRGHTDTDPVKRAATIERFPHGNVQLSAARAVEVAALLFQSGVREERVVVAGFGPAEPVAPNDTPDNKRRNRRVEIFVLEDAPTVGASGGQ